MRICSRRFADRRDEAAFATLLARHGPMVRAVCRRHCGDPHLAADAEQGVWLVLARRAASVSRPERLAGWLFGVAVRVGRKVASGAAHRPPRPALATAPDVAVGVMAEELLRVLDEELAALPEAERAPLVLCYLEGRTQDEARGRAGHASGRCGAGWAVGRQLRRGWRPGVAPAVAARGSGGGAERGPGISRGAGSGSRRWSGPFITVPRGRGGAGDVAFDVVVAGGSGCGARRRAGRGGRVGARWRAGIAGVDAGRG